MKRISVVIFDCDGVMFDSRQANTHYYNSVLAHFGLPPMKEDDVGFIHMHTVEESIEHIFRETPFVDQAQKYRMQIDYTPFIEDMIIEPGLLELLTILRPQYGLAVATNRSNTIGNVLESNHLTDFFDIVVSSLDVEKPKPHPEALYKILDFFQIDPEQAVYVGDSIVDDKTSRAAGVTLIAYQNNALETPWQVKNLLEITKVLEALEEKRQRL